MQLRALTTFKSRYGMIRSGQNFTAEQAYGRDLVNGKKAMEIEVQMPRPGRTQAFKAAPANKGKDEPAPSPEPNMADPADAGEARPASSSRAGRASRRRTRSTPGGE
jgi:hypothetical protein